VAYNVDMSTELLQHSAPDADRKLAPRPVHRSPIGRVRALSRWRAGGRRVAGTDFRANAYGVLQDARALIEQGWVQNRWVVSRAAPPSLRRMLFGGPVGIDDVRAACLVGAVVHAVRQRGATDDLTAAGPALDLLWDAWQESRGLDGPGVAGLAAPAEIRTVRVRDLTRWNDQPGRTRPEVLGLLDLAAGRAILAAVGPSSRGVAQCDGGRRRPSSGGSSRECSGSASRP
jgi:hypothetical protein